MKTVAALLLMGVMTTGTAHAGGQSPPPALASARKAVAAALAAHDLKAIVGLSLFPLEISEYGMPPRLAAHTFLKDRAKFTDIFADGQPSTVQCIRESAPTYGTDAKTFGADAWSIDCNGYDYYFARRGGRWLLIGFANINE